jgi:hypothetical protein
VSSCLRRVRWRHVAVCQCKPRRLTRLDKPLTWGKYRKLHGTYPLITWWHDYYRFRGGIIYAFLKRPSKKPLLWPQSHFVWHCNIPCPRTLSMVNYLHSFNDCDLLLFVQTKWHVPRRASIAPHDVVPISLRLRRWAPLCTYIVETLKGDAT